MCHVLPNRFHELDAVLILDEDSEHAPFVSCIRFGIIGIERLVDIIEEICQILVIVLHLRVDHLLHPGRRKLVEI